MSDLVSTLVPDSDLVAKKGTTSYVWNFFGVRKDDEKEKDTAVCKLCRKSILARGGNTSNLTSHLRNHHQKEYSAVIQAKDAKKKKQTPENFKQVSLPAAIERTQSYPSGSKRKQEITNALSLFIAKEMMPFSMVEHSGFQNLVNKLDDRYEIPSRKYFAKVAIPALYASTRERIAESLKSAEYYSITTDMWSSGKMEPYLAMTVHFVDNEWVLQSYCLQTLFVPENHTAENLVPVLQGVLESWGLPEN